MAIELRYPVPPTPTEILDGADAAPWLHARADKLAKSPWQLDHVAAIGTIHRFWLPKGMAAKIAMLQGQLPAPRRRIDAWVRSLDANDLAEIRRLVAVEIGNLHQFVSEHVEDAADDSAVAEHLADRRDALESVLRVLLQVGKAIETLELLAALDARIVTLWSQLPPAGCIDAEYLRQANVQQPDAWWTAFVD